MNPELPLWHEQPELDFGEWTPVYQQLHEQQQQQKPEPDIEGRDVLPQMREADALYRAYFKRNRDGTTT